MECRLLQLICLLLALWAADVISKRTQVVFLPSKTSYIVDVGRTAVLACAVSHLENRRVIWRKASDSNPLTVGNETFFDNDRILARHDASQNTWNLIIKHVRLTDAGVYECQISSKLRHLRHNVLLTVRDTESLTTTLPRPDIKISGSSYVERGGQIYLICNATGLEHPPDDLDWFLNGNKLTTQDTRNISIKKFMSITARTIVSILEIQGADLSDSGVYVCRTSNLQIHSMRVNVLNANKTRPSVRREKTDQTEESPGGHTEKMAGHKNTGHRDVITALPLFLVAILTSTTAVCVLFS